MDNRYTELLERINTHNLFSVQGHFIIEVAGHYIEFIFKWPTDIHYAELLE